MSVAAGATPEFQIRNKGSTRSASSRRAARRLNHIAQVHRLTASSGTSIASRAEREQLSGLTRGRQGYRRDKAAVCMPSKFGPISTAGIGQLNDRGESNIQPSG